MEITLPEDMKAKAEEFIKLHGRGILACERAMGVLGREKFSIGEVALGALYMLDFLSDRYPGDLLTAERVMAAYRGMKNKGEREVEINEVP